LHCHHAEEISPYSTDVDHYWNNLPSDLIDLFNYFDWIGYLALKKGEAMDLEVVAQKVGPWIINYYQIGSTVNPQHRRTSSTVADRKPTSTRPSGNAEPRPTEES
jgi:hypothetical protein